MTEKPELWKLVREWLSKQKHINRRVKLETVEYGPPYAQLCTVGNRYIYAYIYDDYVNFLSYSYLTEESIEARIDIITTLHAQDSQFFKKMKEQLWKMLYAGNLNWPV